MTLDTGHQHRLLRAGKRLFDVVVAVCLLVLLSPMLLLIALLIKLDSAGPVFFRQRRLGYQGQVFSIFKYRTMISGAERTGFLTYDGDPRVTRVGRVLRQYRLDEFPQLINVIRGEMSLVGPRPLLPDFLEQYREHDRSRMLMPPGMTGWQQVTGGAKDSWEERIAKDVWYVQNWSPWLDLKILLRTPLVVLRADTVFGEDGFQRSGAPDRNRI